MRAPELRREVEKARKFAGGEYTRRQDMQEGLQAEREENEVLKNDNERLRQSSREDYWRERAYAAEDRGEKMQKKMAGLAVDLALREAELEMLKGRWG